MQKRTKEKEEEEQENEYVCERVFIISYEYFSAAFLLRVLDYTMRKDEANTTGIERKWRV
jgi:hypothetical protein